MTPETKTCCGTFMIRTDGRYECIHCRKISLIRKENPPTPEETIAKLAKPKVLCVIPARMDSKRLPGKVLLAETGKPLIQHAWESAKAAEAITHVCIATSDEEILKVSFKYDSIEAAISSPVTAAFWPTREHNSGTDRVAEVAAENVIDYDIIINLQADEPEITGEDLDQLVHALVHHPEADMATLAWETEDPTVAYVGHNVKVVTDPSGRAIYFSRAGIPHQGKAAAERPTEAFIRGPWKIHAGVYAYRREFLLRFAAGPQSALELAEGLEQLRTLEMGAHIHVSMLSHPTRGIDTPEDYREFVKSQKVVSQTFSQLSEMMNSREGMIASVQNQIALLQQNLPLLDKTEDRKRVEEQIASLKETLSSLLTS